MLDWQRLAQNQEQRDTVKVCPSAEDLQWKPPNVGGRWVCPAPGCGMVGSSQSGLSHHINSSHPKLSRTGGKHYASQHWDKRHVCQKCGKKFGLERDWRRHVAVCGTVFSCDSCSASYPSRQALLVHCRRKQHPVPAALNSSAKKNSSTRQNVAAQDAASCEVPSATSGSCPENSQTQVTAATSPRCAGAKSTKKDSTAKQNQSDDVTTGSPTSSHHPHVDGMHTPETSPAKAGRTSKSRKASSSNKASTRPILPKSLLPSVIHVFDVNTSPQTNSFMCSQASANQSSAGIQTDISGITPLYQRLAGVGVSSGCQTIGGLTTNNWSSQNQRQTAVANMATQVSVPLTRNVSSSQISDMATQVSVPLVRNLDGSQISDMATQVSVTLVNSSTQIACDAFNKDSAKQAVRVENAGIQASLDRASMATQIDSIPPVTCAAVQTTHLASVQNTATQATVFCVDNGTQLFLKPQFIHTVQTIDSSAQASEVSMKNNTNTQGTQIFISPILPEAAQTSTTGIQTSVSLLPSRQRRHRTIAQTQTSGDQILKSAMAMAKLPVAETSGRSSRGTSRSPGRKRNVKSSEVQTSVVLPQKRPRKGRKKSPVSTSSQQTNSRVAESESLRDFFEALISDDENVMPRQNPTLSSSAGVDEDSSEADLQFSDLLAKTPPPHTSTSDMSMQVDFEDFLSSYTTDLGVQTQDDFLAACTADFGAQTQDDFFGVCTADFGVQTAATSLGSFLDDLESSVGYGAKVDSSVFGQPDIGVSHLPPSDPSARNVSVVDCAIGTDILSLDTHTQTPRSSGQNPEPASSSTDSGTSPCFAMADIHTQTSQRTPLVNSGPTSTFTDCAIGTDMFLTSSQTQTSQGQNFEDWALGFQLDNSHSTQVLSLADSNNSSTSHFERDPQRESHSGTSAALKDAAHQPLGDVASQPSASASTCTSVDFGAGTGTDMHTQTADDLLEFLMTNMETQTTEDVFTRSLDLTDIQTQTSDVLLTPPHPSSRSVSPYSGQNFGLVTAETQTSSPLIHSGRDGIDDLSNFADIQTQTGFDILDLCTSPTTPNGSRNFTSYSSVSTDTSENSGVIAFSFDNL
ncbi:hypothetical protein BaRGS_00011117 [Batillaria attramentaria]|uniref:C2H2-type domain-containing protein n=1 Tax=Batillaria attramentaria TaxID=370345 RepID=A0ABD0LEI4_9CAEN